jgi:uncharacterized protein YbjT (DUF2867 family)
MSDSEPVRLLLVGSTGLVGRAVMERLVGHDEFDLVALSRREVKLPRGARMQMRLADPALWHEVIVQQRPDVIVCALGTTWRKAGGDEEAFRAVDQQLVLAVARAASAAGVGHFIFVSAAGADQLAKQLYFRVKGEVERALGKFGFRRLDILRPGLLRGRRERDVRFLETVRLLLSPLFDLALQGRRRKYRSILARRLAEAIIALAGEKAGGRFIHEHDNLRLAARRFIARDE